LIKMVSGTKSSLFVLLCFALAGCYLVEASQTLQGSKFLMKRQLLGAGADHHAAAATGDDNDGDDDEDSTTHTEEAKKDKKAIAPSGLASKMGEDDEEEDDEEAGDDKQYYESAEDTRLDKAKHKLAANLREQSELEHRMKQLGDESSSDAEIDTSIKLVTNETQSPAMANMLGHVWKEMRMFEVPLYADHVKDKLKNLKHDERALEVKLTTAQGEVSAGHDKLAKRKTGTAVGKAVRKDKQSKDELDKSKKGAQAQTTYASGSDPKAIIAGMNFWGMHPKEKKAAFMNTLVYIVGGILVALLFQQARSRYPKVFVPEQRADVFPNSKDFSFSLLGFLGDRNLCILGCCCPFLAWADNLDRKELLSFWKAFVAFFGLMLLHVYTMGISSLCIVAIGVFYRQKLRAGYEIENGTPKTVAMDVFAWCCCQPCAIIQEAREETVLRNVVTE